MLPILIAIGATIGGIFCWYNAPMQKLTRALDAYDYSAAAQVLPTLSKDELASVSDQMQEYAQTVIDRYTKSEADYDSSGEPSSTACKSCSRTSVSTISSTAFNR